MNKMLKMGLAKGPIKLGRGGRLSVYLICAGLWLSGAAWLVFHYFMQTPSEFGPQPNPLEPWWLRMHGAFAFGALWMLGVLSTAHIVNAWNSGRRRWSGGLMLGAAVVMSVTGYLLYYLGDEALRGATAVAHWSLGLAAVVIFIWHRFIAAALSKREHFLTTGIFRNNSRRREQGVARLCGSWLQFRSFRKLRINTTKMEGTDE
jgi:hypothetical protein